MKCSFALNAIYMEWNLSSPTLIRIEHEKKKPIWMGKSTMRTFKPENNTISAFLAQKYFASVCCPFHPWFVFGFLCKFIDNFGASCQRLISLFAKVMKSVRQYELVAWYLFVVFPNRLS